MEQYARQGQQGSACQGMPCGTKSRQASACLHPSPRANPCSYPPPPCPPSGSTHERSSSSPFALGLAPDASTAGSGRCAAQRRLGAAWLVAWRQGQRGAGDGLAATNPGQAFPAAPFPSPWRSPPPPDPTPCTPPVAAPVPLFSTSSRLRATWATWSAGACLHLALSAAGLKPSVWGVFGGSRPPLAARWRLSGATESFWVRQAFCRS